MLLEDDIIFKDSKEARAVFDRVLNALRVCDSEEDLEQWKRDCFFELIALKADDDKRKLEKSNAACGCDISFHDIIMIDQLEQQKQLIKERENAFRG